MNRHQVFQSQKRNLERKVIKKTQCVVIDSFYKREEDTHSKYQIELQDNMRNVSSIKLVKMVKHGENTDDSQKKIKTLFLNIKEINANLITNSPYDECIAVVINNNNTLSIPENFGVNCSPIIPVIRKLSISWTNHEGNEYSEMDEHILFFEVETEETILI